MANTHLKIGILSLNIILIWRDLIKILKQIKIMIFWETHEEGVLQRANNVHSSSGEFF